MNDFRPAIRRALRAECTVFHFQTLTVNSQPLLNPVPVRFPEVTRARIHRAAKRFSLNASDIIRQAVERQLPEWERSGVLVIKGQEESV